MKSTLYDWRKQTLAGMKDNCNALTAQRDQINYQIDELLKVITTLEGLQMKRPYTKAKGSPEEWGAEKAKAQRKKPTGKKAIPWQHRPENKARAAKWRKMMVQRNKAKRKGNS